MWVRARARGYKLNIYLYFIISILLYLSSTVNNIPTTFAFLSAVMDGESHACA